MWHKFNARLWNTTRSDVCMGVCRMICKTIYCTPENDKLILFSLYLSPYLSVSMHPEAEEGFKDLTKNEIRRHDRQRY